MSKRILCLALCMAFLLGALMQQVTAMEGTSPSEDTTATTQTPDEDTGVCDNQNQPLEADEQDIPAGLNIFLDGNLIENSAALTYQQTTYASLRSIAQAVRPDAVISWEGDHATVIAAGLTMAVYPNRNYFVVNGRYLHLPYGVFLENGVLLLPVRTLAKALGAEVEWNGETQSVSITSGTGAIVSGDEFYNADDLYWLSHIIHAESGNQPLDGKIGVGNVILNRLNNPIFPDTIRGVIFQKNQFSPVSNGTINLTPNAESVIAAKLCLDGAVILSDALWFNRAGVTCWASRNKSCVATIGAHAFYA